MKNAEAIRRLISLCFLLTLLLSVLGVSGELYPEPLVGIELPVLDDLVFLSALDLLFMTLLVCFLLCFFSDLLRSVTLPVASRQLALSSKEILFDHGSRAPPLFC